MKDYSRNGESLVLKQIFEKIGIYNKTGVEFGAGNGFTHSNLRMFILEDWVGIQFDSNVNKKESNGVNCEFITKENVNIIFDKYNVPQKFDFLSIDIDGNDYWVWKEINRKPNVVIIEYNCNFDKNVSLALKYNPKNIWDGSYGYSASFKAMCNLAETKGYYLYYETSFANLFFVSNEFKEILPPIIDIDKLDLPRTMYNMGITEKIFIEV